VPHARRRCALWESAVITYGRMEFSEKGRKLAYDELLRAFGASSSAESPSCLGDSTASDCSTHFSAYRAATELY
jgi:hypothetical protein